MDKRKQKTRPSKQLFPSEQKALFEKSYQERIEDEKNKPVECLGMTIPNDGKANQIRNRHSGRFEDLRPYGPWLPRSASCSQGGKGY